MMKEADRWSDFSLGGSSYFFSHRKLSLINGCNVKKIFKQHMGHLMMMVKQSTFDRFLPLYDWLQIQSGFFLFVCFLFIRGHQY